MSHRNMQAFKHRLLEQLVLFDEQRIQFLDTYFPFHGSAPQQRKKVEQLLHRYVTRVEVIVSDIVGNRFESLSVALIGSRVTIRYLDTMDYESLTLCLPDQTDPDRGMISFLSPLGLDLLLSAPGDNVTFSSPGGDVSIAVCEIDFVE